MQIEQIGNATLYRSDWRQVVPTLSGIGVVITDPPYALNIGNPGASYTMKQRLFE
jgi:23S rRNA G2445 N2-methylase RlmL